MHNFLFLFLLFAFPLCGKIVEIAHFDELKEYVASDTFIILDIDNTLLTPIQEVGTDQWFCHRRDWYELQGSSATEASELALAEWEAVQNITQVKAVEAQTPEIVRYLQNHFTVIGLSTRGLALATRTVYQLKSIGMDLSLSAPTKEDVPLLIPQAILFRKGILFTSGTHKGKALLKLFEKFNYYPKRIVFINDKATNLREIEVACEEQKIPFIGLRYSFLDEKVKSFRSDIARVQFENFKMILSDQEAKHLMER